MTETNTATAATADTFDVRDRSVVITGGTAGIGLAAAAHLAKCGARVVICGRRDAGHGIAAGIGAEFVPMDVSDEASVASGFEAIAGRVEALDALILNAGIDEYHGDIESLDLQLFERIMDTNTLGVARTLSHGIGLVRDHGSVIVTSSPAGSVAAPGMAAYAASKAALDHLVRVWALELGPRHIRVNAVLPGLVESEMSVASAPDFDVIRQFTANSTIRQPPEIAPVFHFLVSDASTPLTGSLVGCHDGIPAGFSLGVVSRLAAAAAESSEEDPAS